MPKFLNELLDSPRLVRELVRMGEVIRKHVTVTRRTLRDFTVLPENRRLYHPVRDDDPLPRQLMNTQAIYLGDDIVLARNAFGQKMFLPAKDLSVAPHLMMDGLWEEAVSRAMLRLLKPGMRTLDLGANTGYYSLLFARAVGPEGRVDAFEANGFLAELVNRSLLVNGYNGYAECHSAAVADKSGTLTFRTLSRQMGSGALGNLTPDEGLGETVTSQEVQSVCLDDFFPDPDVDFIKIDCEGAEPLIIAGAEKVLTCKPNLHLFFEFLPNDKKDGAAAIFSPLSEMGYRFFEYGLDGHPSPVKAAAIIDSNQWAEVYARRGDG